MNTVKKIWDEHPLISIIIIALIPRIVAAIFSKGYGMHDDHFGPIEQPFQIMHDITYWTNRGDPHGHSIVYPSLHFILFNMMEAVGIYNPQVKMYIVRFLHALYSLLAVIYGYKIAELLSNKNVAKKVGIALALFWAFPFLSVRNLIEVVCIPPLMIGFYYLISALNDCTKSKYMLISGLFFGLAFIFRYQSLSIIGIVGLILILKKKIKFALWLSAGFLFIVTLIQGSADIFAWGYPFASFMEYLGYNVTHGQDYTTGAWYNYLLLIVGAFIPPVSFLLLFGVVFNWRKTFYILFPITVFFILHSLFPNKQERFIFPVIPFYLMLGIIGWENFANNSKFCINYKKYFRALWIYFWIINMILLVPFTLYYSKRARVESMYALYGKQVSGIVLIGGKLGAIQPPLFYSGTYPVPIYRMDSEEQIIEIKQNINSATIGPNYAIFFGLEDIDNRVKRIKDVLNCDLYLENVVEASFLDNIFYLLNPKYNKNQTTFIYKLQKNKLP